MYNSLLLPFFCTSLQLVEDNTTSPTPSQDDVICLSREAADLFEQEVGIYDKSECVAVQQVFFHVKLCC